MGDSLKITKDKRHRSSSSLAGAAVEGTRSERKIDIRVSIPEVDDQFATAEARCYDLQEKIDLVKTLRRKRRLKKRSMTTVLDQTADQENIPLITVRKQPKKKVSQAAHLRAYQMPQNPTRGYLDPATVEQRRMIGQVRGYHQTHRRPLDMTPDIHTQKKQGRDHRSKQRKVRPDGDSEFGVSAQTSSEGPLEVACGRDIIKGSDIDVFNSHAEDCLAQYEPEKLVRSSKPTVTRRRVPRDVPTKQTLKSESAASKEANSMFPVHRRPVKTAENGPLLSEERPVVELFTKQRGHAASHRVPPPPAPEKNKKPKVCRGESSREPEMNVDEKKENHTPPRRSKSRSHRYEMPTIASQMKMKKAGTRCYGSSNKTNIPFVVSKSTTPSHNIGVNLQQVLNGIKTQQPLTGIPMTIAHHMGMKHVPSSGVKSTTKQPSLENREINTIKVGERLLHLPSYKYMSYDRLLNLYRESGGIVSKFLRANSRPQFLYTSMFNLGADGEDLDGATSKGQSGCQEAKQSLAEYASLYREFEQLEATIQKGNNNAELERRKDELSRELAAREDDIRKVVQDYRTSCDVDLSTLRTSQSTTEEGYRHSTFKLNFGEPHP